MTAHVVTVRLPFSDVERFLAASIAEHCQRGDEAGATNYLADRIGTTRRNITRWRVLGLSERQADWVATQTARHARGDALLAEMAERDLIRRLDLRMPALYDQDQDRRWWR